jgi:hypothetical protein
MFASTPCVEPCGGKSSAQEGGTYSEAGDLLPAEVVGLPAHSDGIRETGNEGDHQADTDQRGAQSGHALSLSSPGMA